MYVITYITRYTYITTCSKVMHEHNIIYFIRYIEIIIKLKQLILIIIWLLIIIKMMNS